MNASVSKSATRMSGHIERVRERTEDGIFAGSSGDSGGFLPPIQIGTTGSPISLVDATTNAIVIGATFALMDATIGSNPTDITPRTTGAGGDASDLFKSGVLFLAAAGLWILVTRNA